MKRALFLLCLALAGCATADRALFDPSTVSTAELYRIATEERAWTDAGLWRKIDARREYGKRMGWGDDADRLAAGYIWRGMTKEQLTLLRGRPARVNITNLGAGNSEQWIYSPSATPEYFYFEDGRLTAWQIRG